MIFRKLVLDSFKPMRRGALEVALPGGGIRRFGGLSKRLVARIEVRSESFFRRCVLFGPIGFAEAYIEGEWDTPDLTRVIAWFILNAPESRAIETGRGVKPAGFNLLKAANRLAHKRRPNSLRISRRNIAGHYDLGNDFFRLWLDPTMTYSCAYFDPPESALRDAQVRKYDGLCRKLQISAGDEVLEIGTGWGGFSLHAAGTYGCRVTTITISEEQFAEASRRVAEAGLAGRVTVRLEDYRAVRGQFDKIVSIEMIEAVGDRYLETFLGCCQRMLRPRGLLGFQMITCPDGQFEILRDGVDFIQKHIFPGSLLVSQARMTAALNRIGDLNLYDWEDMGMHYAKTLAAWRGRFEARIGEVRALGFDDRFIRKWRYYLCYCEAAFGTRNISVVQAIYTRPNNLGIRSPIYDLLR